VYSVQKAECVRRGAGCDGEVRASRKRVVEDRQKVGRGKVEGR
jgi:hypothetical protein